MSAKLALLTTCKQWREAGFHQAIVDSITQVDNYKADADLCLALATAYNEMPNHELNANRAIGLLLPHLEEHLDDIEWRYQMALCYSYIDRPHRALGYAVQVAEKDAQYKNVNDIIEHSVTGMQVAFGERAFTERIKEMWKLFEAEMDNFEVAIHNFHQDPDALMKNLTAVLNVAVKDIDFGVSIDSKKPSLFLPIGDLTDAFKLWRLTFDIPAKITERWDIRAGHPFTESGDVSVAGMRPEDIEFWIDEAETNNAYLALQVYSPKIKAIFDKEGETGARREASGMINMLLGDVNRLRYIYSMNVMESRPEGKAYNLKELPAVLKERGAVLDGTLNDLLNEKMGYQLKPSEKDPRFRADVSHGITQHARLISEWYEENPYTFDRFADDGIIPAMIVFELPEDKKTDDPGARLDLAGQMAGHLINLVGDEKIRVFGLASGLKRCYIDCLFWSLPECKAVARVVADGLKCPYAVIQFLDWRFPPDDLKEPLEKEEA
ncbi:MAG: hypothetical protein KHY22_03180 [Sutterella wadsworthensis]|jgi:hypothetical protein|nr:hypothetical protein [Sutterella wadsworthensis]